MAVSLVPSSRDWKGKYHTERALAARALLGFYSDVKLGFRRAPYTAWGLTVTRCTVTASLPKSLSPSRPQPLHRTALPCCSLTHPAPTESQ